MFHLKRVLNVFHPKVAHPIFTSQLFTPCFTSRHLSHHSPQTRLQMNFLCPTGAWRVVGQPMNSCSGLGISSEPLCCTLPSLSQATLIVRLSFPCLCAASLLQVRLSFTPQTGPARARSPTMLQQFATAAHKSSEGQGNRLGL